MKFLLLSAIFSSFWVLSPLSMPLCAASAWESSCLMECCESLPIQNTEESTSFFPQLPEALFFIEPFPFVKPSSFIVKSLPAPIGRVFLWIIQKTALP